MAQLRQRASALRAELRRRELLELKRLPEVFRPFLQPSRYKAAYGGRGTGKSHAFAELLLAHCVRRPTRAVCVREIQVSLEQSVKRLLEDKIKEFSLQSKFRILNTHIETPGDGIIIFQGMQNHTAESLKSLEGYDIAWVEEAQSLSQRSLTLLRPTLRKENSELWFSWNPRFDTDPVDEFFRGPVPPDDDMVVVNPSYLDNPYFPDVLRRDMERDQERDADRYAHVWLGAYETHSDSRVFKNWRVEEFDTPSDSTFYFGGDWGFSVDPTVLVRCWVKGKTLFVDHEIYRGPTALHPAHREPIEIDRLPEVFETIPAAKSWPIIADSARPETISYLKRHGFPKIEPSIKGKDSVKEGIIFLQSYDIVVHKRCPETARELMHYSFKKDPKSDIVTPVLEDKKNHVIDSLRYAVERLRRKQKATGATW